jgi:hypothetical protein
MSSLTQRLAASAMVVHAEKICAMGWLPEPEEMHLRVMIAAMRSAYGPEVPERECNVIRIGDHDPEYRRTIEAVSREMGT